MSEEPINPFEMTELNLLTLYITFIYPLGFIDTVNKSPCDEGLGTACQMWQPFFHRPKMPISDHIVIPINQLYFRVVDNSYFKLKNVRADEMTTDQLVSESF